MIVFEVVEKVLDDFYFCYSPGHHGDLFHLVDDCFTGFVVDIEQNKLKLFNYYDCDFDTMSGAQEFEYKLPKTFSKFLDLLNKHELLFDNEGYKIDKKYLLNQYQIESLKNNYKPFVEPLSKKYKNECSGIC